VTDYIPATVLAKKLGLKASTLNRWRRSTPPKGPQGWIKYSETVVVYPAEEVQKWLDSRSAA
jgi:transposase-like protein